MSPSRLESLLAEFPAAELSLLTETRRDFHAFPELAYEERRTSEAIAQRLTGMGLAPKTGVGRTGVVAEAGADGERLLWRADMDALPLDEDSAEPYVSRNAGRMHACGHDGHMAISLAVARRLAADPLPLPRGVRFLYQPAEEGRGGAEACVRDGVLEGVGAAFGLHLWSPIPVGRVGVNRGALMAAVDRFSIEVEGRGGHGAMPHEAADPILAAARIVEALQAVVAREISPLDSAVVTVGSIHGGTAFNVIPGSVRLEGTARSFSPEVGKALPEKIGRVVAGTASACGVSARLDYERTNEATVNDPAMADLVIEVAGRLLGPENVETDARTLAGEDMSVYLQRVPGCFFFVGCGRNGESRPHHSPTFEMDERALAVGARLAEAVLREAARRFPAAGEAARRFPAVVPAKG